MEKKQGVEQHYKQAQQKENQVTILLRSDRFVFFSNGTILVGLN
jgi:hypothetical protein